MSKDARPLRCLAGLLAMICLPSSVLKAGTYQTVNFTVTADRDDVAQQVGKQAEIYRRQLAIFWLGKPLPNWSRPCRISVREGALGAGGQTTFQFARGEVLNWKMSVQGSLERILDSVLPHEINHTIFACHFRRPLPRWADEGAATLFEHRSEQLKQLGLLNQVIDNGRERISLQQLLSMKEYPRDPRAMLTLYAQGYALADFLVQQKGRQVYLKFITDGEQLGWDEAIRSNFDHEGIASLERNWCGWVMAGMPKLTLPREQMLAAAASSEPDGNQEAARPELAGSASQQPHPPANNLRRRRADEVVRSQSPDEAGRDRSSTVAPKVTSDSPIQPTHGQRHSSLAAPVPRNRMSDADSGASADFFAPATTPADGSDVDSSASQRFSNDDEARLFGQTVKRQGLEATALVTDPVGSQPNTSPFNPDSANPSRTLSVERDGNTGRTPQWAGFPGQSKLF